MILVYNSRAGSTTGAITNNIVARVSELLQSDSVAVLQRTQGIIKYTKRDTSHDLPNKLGVDWYQIVRATDYESFK